MLNGWIDGRMNVWLDRWMDGWMVILGEFSERGHLETFCCFNDIKSYNFSFFVMGK